MYIKFGFYQFRKNIAMNLFVMVQMVIVLFSVICLSSIVSYYYNYYHYFENYFKNEGWLYYTDGIISEDKFPYQDAEEFEKRLTKADVAACYTPWIMYVSQKGIEQPMRYRAYDREIITSYAPEIAEGKWLDDTSKEEGIIPAVISYNTYGISVGDVLSFVDREIEYNGYEWKVEIVGVLEDGARIIGRTEDSINDTKDYRNLYYDYYLEDEGKPILLMDIQDIMDAEEFYDQYKMSKVVDNTVLVGYHADITADEINANEKILKDSVDTVLKYSMRTIRTNSTENMLNRLLAFAPVFAGTFILMIISTISVSTIVIKQQLRNYAIYSICGMNWGKGIVINIVNTTIITVMATVVITLLSIVLSLTGFVEETTISFGILQILSCLLVAGLYILLSTIIPIRMIRHSAVREILVENKE